MADLPAFAISVRQPWAWAIFHGGKDVENRAKRAITLGGMDKHTEVAIHAAAGMTRDEYEYANDFMRSFGVECPLPGKLVRGGIIGYVGITGVVKESDSDWFFGPWALTLQGAKAIEPIPAIGQLGAFRWERGGALREPLPWMAAWPDGPRRHRSPARPADIPLFGKTT